MSAARPTEARGVATAVYDQMKDRLREGVYRAGERISVEGLRREFHVSKQPVMTALHQLANEGLVTIRPQVGCRVATYTPQEVEDFFHMFGAFEGAIAAAAARRRTAEQIPPLWDVCDATKELTHLADPGERTHEYLRLNRTFHRAIHAMAHSPIMADQSRRLWDLSDLLISTAGVPHPVHHAIPSRHADHVRVLQAIEAGDDAAARDAMEHHILGTIEIIREGTGPGGDT